MKKYTGVLKSLKQILEIEEVASYGEFSINFGGYVWCNYLNKYIGKKINIVDSYYSYYDYEFLPDKDIRELSYGIKKEWLTDIKEEIDLSKVEVDTKVLVKNKEEDDFEYRHFAICGNGKIGTYPNGKTSWSTMPEDKLEYWNILSLEF